MLNSLGLLVKAGFKRGKQLTPQILSECAEVQVNDPYFKIDYANYQDYELDTDWPEVYMHPCYLQMASLAMQLKLLLDKRSPFKTMGLVHIHNHIFQHHEIEKGQPFALQCRFGNVYRHAKGVAFEVIVTGGQRGRQVYKAIGTYLERRKLTDALELPESKHLPLVLDDQNSAKRELGDLSFSSRVGRKYAKISGDYNPIHLYSSTAKLLGFKKAIAHGMFSLASSLSIEEEKLRFRAPDEPVIVQCDFLSQSFCPQLLKFNRALTKWTD